MVNRAFFLILAAFATSASAQSTQTFGEKIWWASDHNRFAAEVSRAAGVPHPGIPYTNPPSGSAPFRNGAIVPQSGDWPSAAMRGNLPGNGPVIDVNAKFKPTSTAAALGRFAAKALPVAGAAIALYDLIDELGFDTQDQADGTKQFGRTTTTGGEEYRANDGIRDTGWVAGKTPACTAFAAIYDTTNPAGAPYTGEVPSGNSCHVFDKAGSFSGSTTMSKRTSPLVEQFTPSDISELVDSIASQSGWPSSSSIVPTIKEALESGESIDTDTPTVSGPASQVVNQSTTNNTSNNITTNTTTTNNYTYEGNEVTVNQTTIATTINNTTGATTTETTTTQNQQENKPPETPFEMPCGIAGKPPCDVKVDETGTEVYDPEKFKLPEDLKTKTDELLETVSGDTDKAGLFDSFRSLFTLPPLRECEAIQFPEVAGMSVPSLNPCPATDWLRGIMAFVWAVAGLAFCWSCVEEATKA